MHIPFFDQQQSPPPAGMGPSGFSGQHPPPPGAPPPPYFHPQAAPPPSGYRVALTTDGPFPHEQQFGRPPCVDADGHSPVFFGSAIFQNSVHPCKVAPHLGNTACRVPYGGQEFEHKGRYDLLPFTPDMELVPTSDGRIPPGRRPIEGGYEENGPRLFHALAVIDGVRVPGKTGEHLRGCNVAYGGGERYVENYEILCWRN